MDDTVQKHTPPDQLRIMRADHSSLKHLNELGDILDPYREIDYFETCLEKQEKGTRDIFLSLLDNAYIGYVMLNYAPRYGLYKKLAIPEIQDLRVLPQYRKQGVGGALVAYCEKVAKNKKHSTIGISVGLNASYGAAQRLYAKMGYIPDGAGVTYDRKQTTEGELRPLDDLLCLMMTKDL